MSYSHKDEKYKDELNTHLASLQRNKTITSWHDRKITPGQSWSEEISSELESSDIVLLLVSSDFLYSDYCYEKEMLRAIEKHNNNELVVLPIIIRACDWEEAPFSQIQSLPKDVKPISSWHDIDSAWLDVVSGIRKTIEWIKENDSRVAIQEVFWVDSVSPDFQKWLNDTEVKLVHRNVSEIKLDDIFVPPDLKVLADELDEYSGSVSCDVLLKGLNRSMIFGDEQSGKTALVKYLYKGLVNGGYWPLYISGEEVKTSDFDKLITKKSSEQYAENIDYQSLTNRVLLIDNFSKNKLNKKYLNRLIQKLKSNFDKLIFVSIDSYQYIAPEIEELDDFEFYEILNFGNLKRSELIEKWVSLGCEEEIEEKELYSKVDEIKIKIDGVARGNVLPPKPIFILTLLQMFESFTPQKVELTSYGHCYQYLIYQSLEKARIKNSDIDIYMNFLTEFGCAQFNNDGKGLNEEDVRFFHTEYEKKFLKIDLDKIIGNLINTGILAKKNDKLQFKYSYIYYYFTAKKLADSVANDESTKKNIQNLLANLHREDCANIIIFITHHSRDNWVLDEIQMCMMELFSDCSEASLDSKSLEFMQEFLKEIPSLVIEHRRVEEERKRTDQEKDELENNIVEESDKLEPSDILAKINRTFKGIEIIGQIIRNRHGSLDKEKLEELATQAYGVGLRFLQYFLDISDISKEEVVKSIENMLKENPLVQNDVLEKEAKNIFLLMTYSAIFGVLRKVSISIGSKEANEIYENIEAKTSTPAVKLINQAISLQFSKTIDAKTLRGLVDEFAKNPTCEKILKEFVIQHIYMFPVDYKQKQKVADLLKIPIANQIGINKQKSFKV
ncbi:MAG: toll/interleukin-1 receptor domain-containing protein [Gammaproteobacteria bacterium]|nr:toll/interleukin-1 receptor domain-containing protein [Gammaproteobacteria bacterium]